MTSPAGSPRGASRRSRQRAKRAAKSRQAQWAKAQEPDAPLTSHADAETTADSAHAKPRPSMGDLFWPVAAALSAVVCTLFTAPLLGNPWRWAGLLWAPLGVLALLYTAAAWHAQRTPRWPRIVGSSIAAFLLLAFGAGIATQVVVDGRPALTGTTLEVTYRLTGEIEAGQQVLTEQQGLLSLPPEQVRTLTPEFTKASELALTIAEEANPALETALPVPSLYDAYRRVTRAGALQSEGLDALAAYAKTPEPTLLAQVTRARTELNVLLGSGPGSITEAVEQARAEARVAP